MRLQNLGYVLVMHCATVAVADTLAGHLHQFGAGVGCDVVAVVHPFVTSYCPARGRLRALFTEQHARPVAQRPRLRIVPDAERAPE